MHQIDEARRFYIPALTEPGVNGCSACHSTGHHLHWMGRCPKGGWDNGCLPIHICEKLIHFFKRQSSPPTGSQQIDSPAFENFNEKYRNYRFFESICPLTAIAELSRRESLSTMDFLICHEYVSSVSLIFYVYRHFNPVCVHSP